MFRTFNFLMMLLAFNLFTFHFSQAFACSVCGCGDPLLEAGTTHPMPGTWRINFESLYLTATAQSDDNPLQTESLTQKTLNTIVTYNPVARLTLVGIVPYTQKDWALSAATDGSDPADSASPVGFGDLNFGLRYFLISDVDYETRISQNFAITAGTVIPTGNENGMDAAGSRIDQHAQLGTGGWGPYGGFLYSFLDKDWMLSANGAAIFHTVNPYQYTYGMSFNWGAQAMLHLNETFALSLGTDGRYSDHDTDSSVTPNTTLVNTGGTVIDLTPGIAWSPSEDWGLYSRIQIPIIASLFGTQTVGATVIVGTQLLVH
jgi:hypothetical protein